jgi:hypothetical protein
LASVSTIGVNASGAGLPMNALVADVPLTCLAPSGVFEVGGVGSDIPSVENRRLGGNDPLRRAVQDVAYEPGRTM